MSPVSRGRKRKTSSKSKQGKKRPSSASARVPTAGLGVADPRLDLGNLSIGLSQSLSNDASTGRAEPDRFGPSQRRLLSVSYVLLQAQGPRMLEQATAELVGAELRKPELSGLRFDLWCHGLVATARDRVLSDVDSNGTWRGPWWLLHGLASIGSYGLGGYARQQAAEVAKSLPPDRLAEQPDWLALMPDIEMTGAAHVLRDVYGTRFAVITRYAMCSRQ